jgi:hypothetical protein
MWACGFHTPYFNSKHISDIVFWVALYERNHPSVLNLNSDYGIHLLHLVVECGCRGPQWLAVQPIQLGSNPTQAFRPPRTNSCHVDIYNVLSYER